MKRIDPRAALCALWLACCPAAGQIALPDYLNPDAEPEGEGGTREAPRHAPAEAETEEDAELSERLLQQLNSSRLNLSLPPEAEGADPAERVAVERVYLGGPERVRLILETRGRERLGGEVVNQTMLVETPIGGFPVRLHDLLRVERLESGAYRFEFRGGDLLEGTPGLDALTVLNLDGSRRVLGFGELREFRIELPKETE